MPLRHHLLLFLLPLMLNGQSMTAAAIDAWAQRIQQDYETPGLAIAVVTDGEILLADGYGVLSLENQAPVDENSLFGIASISKSFTALALAMLVDRGELHWKDQVITYLPDFALYDPWVTREFTIEDLLIHRSGLSEVSGGTLWYGSDYDRAEVVRRLRYLKPESSFRTDFAYQNVLYLVAGELVPAITDLTWDTFLEQEIFQPLGMTRSNTSIHAMTADANVAQAHAILNGQLQQIPLRDHDNIGPAASVNTSARDIAAYMQFMLDEGIVAGDTLCRPPVMADLWQPRSILKLPAPEPADQAAEWARIARHYGYGWIIQDHRGTRRIYHSGGIDGLRSLITLIPEKDLGVAVMVNRESRAAVYALTSIVLDLAWGIEDMPWYEATLEREKASRRELADQQLAAAELQPGKRGPAWRHLPGRYESEVYGEITIDKAGYGMRMEFSHTPGFGAELVPWKYDTLLVKWDDPYIPQGKVHFTTGRGRRIQEMHLDQPDLLDVDFRELHPIRKLD